MTENQFLNLLSDLIDDKLQSITANMATKDDIANMATKDDIANMATRDEVERIVASAKNELYDEIVRSQKYTEKIEKRVDILAEKVDMLVLKADNTALLLKLYNQQDEDITLLKARVEKVEMKLA